MIFGLLGLIALAAVCFTSCKQTPVTVSDSDSDTLCSCPHSFLHLQPYGDFTTAEAERIAQDVNKNMPILADERGLQITILPAKELPAMAYSKNSRRYRADSLLTYGSRINTDKDKRVVLMGLTHKDIAATIHGVQDFGIIGFSLCPGRSSIVSTYRIPKTEYTWRTVVHEYLHTQGVPHCPNDDPACIMCDAKGKAPKYSQAKGICHECAVKAMLPIYDESVKYIK